MILVINKSDSHYTVIRFCYHSYDDSLNWTLLSPNTTYYHYFVFLIDSYGFGFFFQTTAANILKIPVIATEQVAWQLNFKFSNL